MQVLNLPISNSQKNAEIKTSINDQKVENSSEKGQKFEELIESVEKESKTSETDSVKNEISKVEDDLESEKKLNDYIRDNLNNLKIVINSNINCSPYIINLSIPGINGETLVHTLEQKDIYVSTGSSCSSKLAKPEKTVYAISKDDKRAKSVLRISLSFLTTKNEVEQLVEVLNSL